MKMNFVCVGLLPVLLACGPRRGTELSPAPESSVSHSSKAYLQLAEPRPLVETFFDTAVADPFRWLEATEQPEVMEWVSQQDSFARATLRTLPQRTEILAELDSLRNMRGDIVIDIRRIGANYYILRRPLGDRWVKLFTRPVTGSTERLLLSSEQLAVGDTAYTLERFLVSPDGAHVAYGARDVSRSGLLAGVVDTHDGRIIRQFPMASPVTWTPDSRRIVIRQLTNTSGPVSERFDCPKLVMRDLGATHPDLPLFGCGVFADVKVEPRLSPSLTLASTCDFAIVGGWLGSFAANRYYFAPRSDVLNGRPRWRILADTTELVQRIHCVGSDLYMVTSKPSPMLKIIRTRMTRGGMSRVDTLSTPPDAVIDESALARDALYVSIMRGGINSLLRFPWTSAGAGIVPLPYAGSLTGLNASADTDGAEFYLSGWTTPPAHYVTDPRTGVPVNTGLFPASRVDWSGIEVKSVNVQSHDGTLVPLTILHASSIRLDGNNPAVLNGYGAFGLPVKPFVYAELLPWLRRGGVWAYPHVRGGGEFGQDWHRAGQKLNKPNSWKDLIACAEYLVRAGYSSPRLIGVEGSSAGGLLAGRAITERPELFGAAVMLYSALNPLRFGAMANSVVGAAEFGSASTLAGFRGLLAMDSYHHVTHGILYPPTLLIHGTEDLNVKPWNSYKMAARLQDAGAPPGNALLRVTKGAGHGFGGRDGLEARAEIIAFFLNKLVR